MQNIATSELDCSFCGLTIILYCCSSSIGMSNCVVLSTGFPGSRPTSNRSFSKNSPQTACVFDFFHLQSRTVRLKVRSFLLQPFLH